MSWKVVGASVTGASHERAGLECQDAICWRVLPGGLLVLAVADGAGSAVFGGDGARVAVRVAVEAVARRGDLARRVARGARAAREAVLDEAQTRGVVARELATTLILLAADADAVCVTQFGDGAVVVRDDAGQVAGLTVPPQDEYANHTAFLTDDDLAGCAQNVAWRGSIAEIAVFTDGLQGLALKLPQGSPHEPFFRPLFQFVRDAGRQEDAEAELREFLRSPRVADRADDDLTLVLAALERGTGDAS